MWLASPGNWRNPGGKNGFKPGGSRTPALTALVATDGIPLAEVSAKCLIPNGDATENAGGTMPGGNNDAAAAAAATFDAVKPPMLVTGTLDELPDPVDEGLGDTDGMLVLDAKDEEWLF